MIIIPKNLRHLFRSELIRQRKSGLRTSRSAIKSSKNGKMADYHHIFSDNSYKKHWARAQKFADFCRKNDIKKMEQITPEFAKKYLIYERNQHVNGYQGYSASTIAADALVINHLLIGTGYWKEKQRLEKSKISGMPKRSNKIVKQRQKPENSKEWINRHPHTYNAYKAQIDTIRAFGLRRRELTGGTSFNGRDGLGNYSLYLTTNNHLFAIVQGKGGKIRWTLCRSDMQQEMQRLYKGKINAWTNRPKTKTDFKHNLKYNKPFFHSFDHNIPTHIHRANYAQHMIKQLNKQKYFGNKSIPAYYREGIKPNGKTRYVKRLKKVNLHKNYQIGIYKAQYGAYYQLSSFMGHGRLDVLSSYLGEGR